MSTPAESMLTHVDEMRRTLESGGAPATPAPAPERHKQAEGILARMRRLVSRARGEEAA